MWITKKNTSSGHSCTWCRDHWILVVNQFKDSKVPHEAKKKTKEGTGHSLENTLWRNDENVIHHLLVLIDQSLNSYEVIYHRVMMGKGTVRTFRSEYRCSNVLVATGEVCDKVISVRRSSSHTCFPRPNQGRAPGQSETSYRYAHPHPENSFLGSVILTCTRFSGQSSKDNDRYDLWCQHYYRFELASNLLFYDFGIQNILWGQSFHKSGAAKSTIIYATATTSVCRPFSNLAQWMNTYYKDAEHIYISLRVVSDLTTSPFYLKEFAETLSPNVLAKTSVVVFNWEEEINRFHDNVNAIIPLNGSCCCCRIRIFTPLIIFRDMCHPHQCVSNIPHRKERFTINPERLKMKTHRLIQILKRSQITHELARRGR